MDQLSEAAREAARKTAATAGDVSGKVDDLAGDITDAADDAAKSTTETAREIYQSAALKAGDTLEASKECVRRNPVPVVLGAVAFGMALGYMLMMARRKPTFGERYAEEPLAALRDSVLGALSPVAQRVHQGYDSARDGAGKAMDRLHGFSPGRHADSFSDQIGRFTHNLKFW